MTKPRSTDVIIFDGSNAAHRISAATTPLTNAKGERVEVMFGLLRLLSAVLRQNPAKRCYVVWDGRGSRTMRQKLDPLYKAHRDSAHDDEAKERIKGMHLQVERFWELFGSNLPLHWMSSQRYEADDIIAMLANVCDSAGETCTIVSGDKDLLQLVTKNVSVFSPNSQKYCTKDSFHEYTKGYPDVMAFLYGKCLQGDDSDNIPGIPGVGEKTALKVLSEHNWDLGQLLESPSDDLKKSAVGQKILSDSGRARIALNYRLMSLHAPLHSSVKKNHIEVQTGWMSTPLLKTHLAKQQFASLLASFQQFIGPFNKLEV